jgi:glycosyltransferase involved in cell wall biosynthesis
MQKTLLIFSPSIEDGGVEKNLYNITNYLSDKIYKVSIISANYNKRNKFKNSVNFISPKNNFWNYRNRYIKTFICLFLFLLFFIKEKNKVTIFSFNSNIFAILTAKIFFCNIIIRSNQSPQGYSRNSHKKIIFSIILKLANKIIVNSLEFKKQIKLKFGVEAICIYNPLENIKYIKKLSNKKVSLNFFKKDYLNIISIGRLVKQKDHITLLKAIKILSNKINMRLIIIGDGEEKKKLSNFINDNKLKKIVKIIKFQKNPYPYILKSNLFILPSLYEGLPNVLLEAQSLKKFIISTNCPTGPKEILSGGKYGELFKIKDYKQLAYKISYFNKNKKKNNKKINLGYQNLSRFNFEKNLMLYLKTIKKFL